MLKPIEEAIRELSYKNLPTVSAEIAFLHGTKFVMNSYTRSNNSEHKIVDSFANYMQKVINSPFPFYQNVKEDITAMNLDARLKAVLLTDHDTSYALGTINFTDGCSWGA